MRSKTAETTCTSIAARSAPGSLGSWIFAPRKLSHTLKPSAMRGGGHPDVDPEPGDVGLPDRLAEIVRGQSAGEAELSPDGLAHLAAVERPGEGVDDGVGDGAVVLVAQVHRGDVVEVLGDDRAEEQLEPLRGDAPQVRVHHRAGPGPELLGDGEDGAEGAALARDPVVRRDDLVDRAHRVGDEDGARGVQLGPRHHLRGAVASSRRRSSRSPPVGPGSTWRGRPPPPAPRGRWCRRCCSSGCPRGARRRRAPAGARSTWGSRGTSLFMPPPAEATRRPARRAPPPPSLPVRRLGPARRRAGPRRGWRRSPRGAGASRWVGPRPSAAGRSLAASPSPTVRPRGSRGRSRRRARTASALVAGPGQVVEPTAPGDPHPVSSGRRLESGLGAGLRFGLDDEGLVPLALGARAAASGDSPVMRLHLLGRSWRRRGGPPPSRRPPRRAGRPAARAGRAPAGATTRSPSRRAPGGSTANAPAERTRAPPFSTMRGVSRSSSSARGSISARVLLLQSTRAMRCARSASRPGRAGATS